MRNISEISPVVQKRNLKTFFLALAAILINLESWNCCIIIHCLEVSCTEDQIMSVQCE